MTGTTPEQDTAPDTAQTFLDWTRLNSRALTAGAAVVAVAALGYWFYVKSREIQSANADKALVSARESLDKGNLPLAQSDLQRVVSRYASTPSGLQAAMLLAQMDYDQGKYPDGQKALNDMIPVAKATGSEVALRSLVGDGYMQMGKPLDAAKAYETAASSTALANEKQYQQAKAARAYEAGRDTAKARQLWSGLADDPKAGAFVGEARLRLGELTAASAKPN
jgi:predicted negative regulator of RcsB-dependent stress response